MAEPGIPFRAGQKLVVGRAADAEADRIESYLATIVTVHADGRLTIAIEAAIDDADDPPPLAGTA